MFPYLLEYRHRENLYYTRNIADDLLDNQLGEIERDCTRSDELDFHTSVQPYIRFRRFGQEISSEQE